MGSLRSIRFKLIAIIQPSYSKDFVFYWLAVVYTDCDS